MTFFTRRMTAVDGEGALEIRSQMGNRKPVLRFLTGVLGSNCVVTVFSVDVNSNRRLIFVEKIGARPEVEAYNRELLLALDMDSDLDDPMDADHLEVRVENAGGTIAGIPMYLVVTWEEVM